MALELLGAGEHRLRCLPVQTNDAEQDAPRAGRLRGRESCQAAEDVLAQVGVHLHAGRCNRPINCATVLTPLPFAGRIAEQGGQEAGQAGAQGAGLAGARLLGRAPTHARLREYHRDRYQEGVSARRLQPWHWLVRRLSGQESRRAADAHHNVAQTEARAAHNQSVQGGGSVSSFNI